jgi:hypothetical protein
MQINFLFIEQVSQQWLVHHGVFQVVLGVILYLLLDEIDKYPQRLFNMRQLNLVESCLERVHR